MKTKGLLLLITLGALAAGACGVGGGVTLALFQASTAPTPTQFTAGTLAIQADRDNNDSVPGPMFYIGPGDGHYPTNYWAPGDVFHRVLQVENVGSLDAWMKTVRATLTAGSADLANKLEVRVTTNPGPDPNHVNPFTTPAQFTIVNAGTLGQFISADQAFAGGPLALNAGDLADLHFWVRLPLGTGNDSQGLSTVVSFTVYAEQMAHNP